MTYTGYLYKCRARETFDSIALEIYGNEKYASELMSFNPQLTGKTIFHGDEEVMLPEVDIEEYDGLPTTAPWKE